MTVEALALLIRLNLVAACAVLAVLALRLPVRRWFGARLAYALWLAIPLAVAAAMAPAPVKFLPAVAPAPIAYEIVDTAALAPVLPPLASQERFAPPKPPADPAALLLGLWLAGSAFSLGVLLFRHRRFAGLAAQGAVGPAVVGVLKPRVILPADFARRFSAEERDLILAHEATHLAAHDSRINAALVGVQCLAWFNPLVHLAAHLIRIDQELACDAAVIGRFPAGRRTYAEALLKTQLSATPLLAGCYWPARAEHPLNQRIAMLKTSSPTRLRLAAGVALIAAASLAGGFAAWSAQPPKLIAVSAVQATKTPPSSMRLTPRAPKANAVAPTWSLMPAPSTVGAVFPETQPPLVDDGQAASRFAALQPSIDRWVAETPDVAPEQPGVARENPQAAARRGPPSGLSQVDVDGLKTIMALRVSVANDDLTTARQRFETGVVTRTDVARAELKKLEAEASSKQLDLALEYVAGIRQEHAVGLRTREEVDRAEAQLFSIVTGQIMSSSR